MNNQQLTKKIETKIKEISSTLTFWTDSIKTYQKKLLELTNQLNTIKKEIKENKK